MVGVEVEVVVVAVVIVVVKDVACRRFVDALFGPNAVGTKFDALPPPLSELQPFAPLSFTMLSCNVGDIAHTMRSLLHDAKIPGEFLHKNRLGILSRILLWCAFLTH